MAIDDHIIAHLEAWAERTGVSNRVLALMLDALRADPTLADIGWPNLLDSIESPIDERKQVTRVVRI